MGGGGVSKVKVLHVLYIFRIELLCISTMICFVPVINVTFFESVV